MSFSAELTIVQCLLLEYFNNSGVYLPIDNRNLYHYWLYQTRLTRAAPDPRKHKHVKKQ